MVDHVTATAVWDADAKRLRLTNQGAFDQQMRRLKPGAGEEFLIRVARPADAISDGQRKYFYGYVVEPLVKFTGDPDWALMLKVMFMPDGKMSLTELSYQEMQMVTEQSEAWARERCPEAYEKFGREYLGEKGTAVPKTTALDKAIANLEGEIAVLQAAVEKLKQQKAKTPVRKPRMVKPTRVADAG